MTINDQDVMKTARTFSNDQERYGPYENDKTVSNDQIRPGLYQLSAVLYKMTGNDLDCVKMTGTIRIDQE